ncbi:SDR family NAD(P)-dependent oxidoreductase, partial [bacterium]|nr:SDR family NAD(P)-dependent oxidoreductase [bacterium]
MKSYLLITGATGGLGKAFVQEAACRGYDLLLTDRIPDGGSFANRLAERFHISVEYRPCDLADDNAREKFLSDLKMEERVFWGLINVAGLDYEGAFLEKNRSQIGKILKVNVLATVDITHGVLSMRDPEQKFRLINVCSLAGYFPMPFKATYAASKGFLIDFSRAIREEIRSFGSVTALCPAGMPTNVEDMRSMFAQGFWGLITSVNQDVVARRTLDAALKGRAVVIPGLLNQLIQLASSFVPLSLKVRYVSKRWKKVREKLDEASYFSAAA